jgi:hypothetical protein
MQARLRGGLWGVCAILWIAGCATRPLSQQPGLVTGWDRAAHPHPSLPSIAVLIHTRQLRFDTPVAAYVGPHWAQRATLKQLEQVLQEFPFLHPSAPESNPTQTPYRLVIEATHATYGDQRLSAIAKFTKYLIPSSERNAVELDAVLSKDGVPLKTFEAVGTYTTKRHLLYLLLPMTWGLNVKGETTAQTFRDLFLQIERDAAEMSL